MDLSDIKPDYMAFCAHWVRWGHGLHPVPCKVEDYEVSHHGKQKEQPNE